MAQPRLFEQPRRPLSVLERALKRAEADILVKKNELDILEEQLKNYRPRDPHYSQAMNTLYLAEKAYFLSLEKFDHLHIEFNGELVKQTKELGLDKLDACCKTYQDHVRTKLASLERMPLSEKLFLSANARQLYDQKVSNFRSKLSRIKELRQHLGVNTVSNVHPRNRFPLINTWLNNNVEFISRNSTGEGRSVAGKILAREVQLALELHLPREGVPDHRPAAAPQPPQRAEGEPERQRREGEPENDPPRPRQRG